MMTSDAHAAQMGAASPSMWQAAVAAMMEGIAILDGDTYRYMNAAHAGMYGWDPEELIGRTWRELYSEPMQEWIVEHAFPSLGRDGHWRGDVVGRKKDGSRTDIEISLVAAPNNLLICCCRQIAERKQRERALKESVRQLDVLNVQLQNANKLKDEFLACMSHELRTPLHAILGHAELLLDPELGAVSDQQRHCIEEIEMSGHHLLELINEVLDVAKLDAGQVKLDIVPADISYVLDMSLSMIRKTAAAKGVRLDVPSVPDRLMVAADMRRLAQVLINLLSNAVKFTPPGGLVSVHAVGCGDWVHLSVVDTGIGIASTDQAALFEAFRQVDGSLTREHGGTGLGLHIAKRLIDLQHGDIDVESTPGRGSRFTVRLPRRWADERGGADEAAGA